MKNQKLWDKTVSILVKAYLNDTLIASDCASCAVGSLVASAMNYKVDPNEDVFIDIDGNKIFTHWAKFKYDCSFLDDDLAIIQVGATGYSVEDFLSIERAFMRPKRSGGNDLIFNRLLSVIDTLMQIHEATDTEAEQAKSLFTKELAVKVD